MHRWRNGGASYLTSATATNCRTLSFCWRLSLFCNDGRADRIKVHGGRRQRAQTNVPSSPAPRCSHAASRPSVHSGCSHSPTLAGTVAMQPGAPASGEEQTAPHPHGASRIGRALGTRARTRTGRFVPFSEYSSCLAPSSRIYFFFACTVDERARKLVVFSMDELEEYMSWHKECVFLLPSSVVVPHQLPDSAAWPGQPLGHATVGDGAQPASPSKQAVVCSRGRTLQVEPVSLYVYCYTKCLR